MALARGKAIETKLNSVRKIDFYFIDNTMIIYSIDNSLQYKILLYIADE